MTVAQCSSDVGKPIDVVVIDDHELVVDALERVLADHPTVRLVGRAASVEKGIATVIATKPDIVIMDFRLPDGSGLDATSRLKALVPDVEVVLLTGFADPALLAKALEAGCAGFVSKGGQFDELIDVVESVAAGKIRVPSSLIDGLVAHLRPRPDALGRDLSAREREVLQMLAAGKSTDEMVSGLTLSVHTVRNHVRHLLTKLHASSRLEAVATARRAGLIGED